MNPESKVVEVRLNKWAVNLWGALLTILCSAVGIALARLLPHRIASVEWHLNVLLVALIVLVPVHEAIHALGLVKFANVAWRDIRFGMMWRCLTPYCHCKVPVRVGPFRRMALLPLWVTGAMSVTALVIYPTEALGVLAGVTIAACAGDVWVAAKLKCFADGSLVKDCPSDIGCDVYSPIPETTT